MVVILLFIIILNIVSIVLMYYCLGDLEKKEKLIFIAAGTAIMYILTSIIYWISTRSIEITEVSDIGRDLITFLFVPINGILILPILSKSYSKFKFGKLNKKVLINRGIVLAILLLIILIFECIYFKNIQQQVVNLINKNQQENAQMNNENNLTDINNNSSGISNEIQNEAVNSILEENAIDIETNTANDNENIVINELE